MFMEVTIYENLNMCPHYKMLKSKIQEIFKMIYSLLIEKPTQENIDQVDVIIEIPKLN